jgi:small-conductance mechanosensitive channel
MYLEFVTVQDVVLTAVSFGVPVIAGYAGSYLLKRIAARMAAAESRDERTLLPTAVRLPIILVGWMVGIYGGSMLVRGYDLDLVRAVNWLFVDRWMLGLATVLIYFLAYRVVLYGAKVASTHTGDGLASVLLIRKLLAAAFVALAAVTLLNQFGVNIGPMLASLGILGLAAALAVQETLGNYIAGVVLALDRPLREGDFVRLESGQEGFVESIGWRTTKIRPYGETTVVVPNSKLTAGIVVNSFYPDLSVRVYVECGVGYENDLQAVEKVCVSVAKETAKRVQGADADFDPIVRFKEFGENNVKFHVVLRCKDFEASLLLKSEFMKSLHTRFSQEGITINYPVRQVINLPMQSIAPAPQEEPRDVI